MSTQKRHASFLRKVFFYFLLLSVLLTVLLTALLSLVSIRSITDVINSFSAKLIAQTNYSITYLDEASSRVSKVLLSEPSIISYLNMKRVDSLTVIQASRTLDRQLLTLDGFDSIYLYNASLDLLYSSKTGEQSGAAAFSDQAIASWLSSPEAVASYDGNPLMLSGADRELIDICTYPIFESGSKANGLRNAIVINVRTSLLTQTVESMTSQNDATTFLVLDGRGRLISSVRSKAWPVDAQSVQTLMERFNASGDGGRGMENVGGALYMVNHSRQNANDWVIVGITPLEAVLRPIVPMTIYALLIVLVIFAGSLMVAYLLSKRIYTPIQAIRDVLAGKGAGKSSATLSATEDFHDILSMFDSMRKQNEQLDRLRREHGPSQKQNLLVSLLNGSAQPGAEETHNRLKELGLEELSTGSLCMCLFKIDRYSQVAAQNGKQERWALRFAIVNVMKEVAEDHYRCEIFNCAPDKFVLLARCDEPFRLFQDKLVTVLREIQSNISGCLNLTLSCAYSTAFKGMENLQSVYEAMQSSIMLKLRYGHNSVISPYMLDEVEAGDFTLSMKQEGQFTERALNGEKFAAVEIYRSIGGMLYRYAYDEILSCELHLAYSLYLAVVERYPEVRGSQGAPLKRFMGKLQSAEVFADIDEAMDEYLTVVCAAVNENRDQNRVQRRMELSERVEALVEQNYADTGLCLSAIAEEMHLSPNYVGHLFKAERQISIAQYILETRMNKLGELLRHSDLSVNEMLEKVGLEKSNYFYTLFKKHFGYSLSEYRQKSFHA